MISPSSAVDCGGEDLQAPVAASKYEQQSLCEASVAEKEHASQLKTLSLDKSKVKI